MRSISASCPNNLEFGPQSNAPDQPNDWQIEIEMLTPVYGNGVDGGMLDLARPFQAKSIRGQLRNWWRFLVLPTTSIREVGSGETLAREGEVFGNQKFASPFKLVIDSVKIAGVRRFEPDKAYGFQDRFGPEIYALFSAKQNEAPLLLAEGSSFRLTVKWISDTAHISRIREIERIRRDPKTTDPRDAVPADCFTPVEVRDQLKKAIWCWLNFGGVGGRTRRGVGACHTKHPDFQLFVGDNVLRYPVVSGTSIYLGAPAGDSMRAWNQVVSQYQSFRQKQRGPMHPKPKRDGGTVPVPGRSFWPEPDSIRHIMGCSLKAVNGPSATQPEIDSHDHSRPVVPVETIPGFPRAALGLPIMFQFAPSDAPRRDAEPMKNKDPKPTELHPLIIGPKGNVVVAKRMASPVITRPVWDGHRWRPMVLILSLPESNNLSVRLTGEGVDTHGRRQVIERDIANDRIVNVQFSRLKATRVQPGAIAALGKHLEANDYAKVHSETAT